MEKDFIPEGRITKEGLEELQKRKGMKLRINWLFNENASKETIRNFANGIGDPNPLWWDEEYARKTRYGCIVAPPSWLYSVFGPGVMHGLPGVQGFHSSEDWEFYEPVCIGDKIVPEAIAMGYEEKPSQFAGKLIMDYQERRYLNSSGRLMAKALRGSARVERKSSREKGKYSNITLPHPWTEAELAKIEDEVLNTKPRGAKPRYWEDTNVDEELTPLVKGPLGLTDEIAYFAGAGGAIISSHEIALRMFRKHPAWSFRDPDTYAMEPIAAVHWNKRAANAVGVPFPYDAGMQRTSWLIQMLTNWMGDDGWLKKCYSEYRRFVYFSDVVRFQGKITKKYVDENGEYCVDIDTTGFNQRSENTIPGHATVVLPSKKAGTWPVEKRMKARQALTG